MLCYYVLIQICNVYEQASIGLKNTYSVHSMIQLIIKQLNNQYYWYYLAIYSAFGCILTVIIKVEK